MTFLQKKFIFCLILVSALNLFAMEDEKQIIELGKSTEKLTVGPYPIQIQTVDKKFNVPASLIEFFLYQKKPSSNTSIIQVDVPSSTIGKLLSFMNYYSKHFNNSHIDPTDMHPAHFRQAMSKHLPAALEQLNLTCLLPFFYSSFNQFNNLLHSDAKDVRLLIESYVRYNNFDLNTLYNYVASRIPIDKCLASFSAKNPHIAVARDKIVYTSGTSINIISLAALEKSQLLSTSETHAHPVKIIALSPCGNYLASASSHELKLWNANTGKCLNTILADHITTLSFSPCSNYIATAGYGDHIDLWDLPNNRLKNKFIGDTQSFAKSLTFSQCGNYIACTARGCNIKIWNRLTDGIQTLENNTRINAISFSSCGQYLANSSNHEILIWNVKTKKIIHTLKGHTNNVFTLSYSPCGNYLVSGDGNGCMRVWDTYKDQCTKNILCDTTSWITSLCFSPCGKYLINTTQNKIYIWDTSLSNALSTYFLHEAPLHELPLLQACARALIQSKKYHLSPEQQKIFDNLGGVYAAYSLGQTLRKCLKLLICTDNHQADFVVIDNKPEKLSKSKHSGCSIQ